MEITLQVNGRRRTVDVEPRALLVHVIRDTLGLQGTHVGCDTTSCGSCAVLLDDVPVKSCALLGVMADGRSLTTVEGLGASDEPDPLQRAFAEAGAAPCGFCTPGMLMVGKSLLADNPTPTEQEVRWAISGNLCRCTGYEPIVDGILRAAFEEESASTEQAR